MEKKTKAELISYNLNHTEVCASAARISTTQGNAAEIFEKAQGNDKNENLIQKVLRSGHRSIIEHAVFTFALKDVSVFTEQFFIECRLASFTVKSRRYVDFSGLGYYIPPDLEGEELEQYCRYMNHLFSAYKTMLDHGIPKEDARFLLPYAFHSNFYCTLNAREFIHIIHAIRHGRGRGIPELQDIAAQMAEQVVKVFPCIRSEMEDVGTEDTARKNGSAEDGLTDSGRDGFSVNTVKVRDSLVFVDAKEIGAVRLISEPSDPARILSMAYAMNHSGESCAIELERLIKSGRPRELEQLCYSFLISDMTLSGITHLVRHRMQSVIIPSIQGIDHSRFMIPDTVKNDAGLCDRYKNVLKLSNDMIKQMSENEKLKQYSYYYALSGNVMDVMVTVNARELLHFMKLRTCSRAQWEIRNISVSMLMYLRKSYPDLFQYYGPGCFVTGKCPEGNMTCGRMEEMVEKFSHLEQVSNIARSGCEQ